MLNLSDGTKVAATEDFQSAASCGLSLPQSEEHPPVEDAATTTHQITSVS